MKVTRKIIEIDEELCDGCGQCVPACAEGAIQIIDGKARVRVVLVGCPKFDDVREYLHRFVEIFKTADIKSVTIPIMEVPCCSGLPMIVKKAMKEAKKEIPLELVVISARGEVMKKEQLAA